MAGMVCFHFTSTTMFDIYVCQLCGILRMCCLYDWFIQNPWGFSHCMTTSTCVISKATMTGLVSEIIAIFLKLKWVGCTEVVEHICLMGEIGFWTFVFRVVSLSLCSRKDCFISGSLDRTVLLWDQRAEKCQVGALAYGYWVGFLILHVFLWMIIICVRILGSLTRTRKACHNLWWSRASFCSCLWWIHKNVWCPQVWKGQLFYFSAYGNWNFAAV